MIKNVLFLLFNIDLIPGYKTKPDLKDCEYVLGHFCEKMIRSEKYSFTKEYFLSELRAFCRNRVIDLEVEVVFQVLDINHIIVEVNGQYRFRFSYWIYYFAASRMKQDKEFAEFILTDHRYSAFPEVIEFYTGIDRSRSDALQILINDLRITSSRVDEKLGLPKELNPYGQISWKPTEEVLNKITEDIGRSVSKSKLPDDVKDNYADKQYDPLKPYNQTISKVFKEYSVGLLFRCIQTSALALRNSDYVDPDIRRELLNEIMIGWQQLSKTILVLVPVLARRGSAVYDGAAFYLLGSFGKTVEERVFRIMKNIPYNIVKWFKDPLFSQKLGPLLYDHLGNEKSQLTKHEIYLLLILTRPRDWEKHVKNYITTVHKNSFYLYDLLAALRFQYRFGFINARTAHEMKALIKMCIAKHSYGVKSPGKDAISKVSDEYIPKREVDD